MWCNPEIIYVFDYVTKSKKSKTILYHYHLELNFFFYVVSSLGSLSYVCFPCGKTYNMTDSIENIGLMIRNERLRKGLTQEELGKRIGVGKAQISKIESGKGLTIKTITKVLDALGMYLLLSYKIRRRLIKM